MEKSIAILGGRVHGVGFKPFLLGKVRRLGLPRFEAENAYVNGREAINVSFGGEDSAALEFLEYCKKNRPPEAVVESVQENAPPHRVLALDEYDKILAAEQQDKMVRSGITMIGMQGKTIGLQEKTLGLQEKTLGLQEKTVGLQEKTIGLQEKTIDKLVEFHKDNIKRFDQADARYEKIAQNLERILEEMKEERIEARKSTERIISMIAQMRPYGAVREKNPVYGAAKKVKKK